MDAGAFDAGWLALREPVDHRSRASALLPDLQAWWRWRARSRVVDLGCGTGSNLRYLSHRLLNPQAWILVDRDPALLDRVTLPDPAPRVTRVRGELADVGLDLVAQADLVTGSALLDLVSAGWVDSLVLASRRAACAALFALTYDGEIRWSVGAHRTDGVAREDQAVAEGEDEDDAVVRHAVNRHQRRDKGLGPALGPQAGPAIEARFRRAGFDTWLLPSPWRLDRGDAELASTLVTGWERAAIELGGPDEWARRIRGWGERRRRSIGEGNFLLTVGHVDLLALPPRPW